MSTQNYVEQRAHLKYYEALRYLLAGLTKGTKNIIDVGSNGVDMLSHLNVPLKYSLDLRNPCTAEGIVPIKEDWLKYNVEEKFDVVCCFQVLEHVADATDFAQKLLSSAKILIVSVPYYWAAGSCKYHVHDPVSEEKLYSWFKRHYDFSMIVHDNERQRLILIYFQDNTKFIDTFISNNPLQFYDINS